MATYFTVVTNTGLQKIANAIATGGFVTPTHMAVGDGNGAAINPQPTATALVNERHRATLNRLVIDPTNNSRIMAELVLPFDVGGWTIREVGLFDNTGALLAIANFPATYKPNSGEGGARDLVIKMYLQVASTAVFTLMIDPAVAVATQAWSLETFVRRDEVDGGTTGQVLRKKSNLDHDWEWANPENVNIIVNAIEELVTLAADQTTVEFTTVSTVGTAYYIEGARLEPGDYTIDGPAQITLDRTYPDGTSLLAVQNEPNSQIRATSVPIDPISSLPTAENVQDALVHLANYVFPVGGIIMWSGAIDAIPSGWALCNGTSGTPDLRNRFVLGAGGARAPGDTGGAETKTTSASGSHTHSTEPAGSHGHSTDVQGGHSHTTAAAGAHTHGIVVNNTTLSISQIPSHEHSKSKAVLGGSNDNFAGDYAPWGDVFRPALTVFSGPAGGSAPHNHGAYSEGAGTHSHTISTVAGHSHTALAAGQHSHTVSTAPNHSHTVNVMPPFYALAYIMRLAA